jgi:hypothetical protein
MARAITGLPEQARHHDCIWVKPIGHSALAVQFVFREMLMDAVSRGKVASHRRRAARRADRIAHVELLEVDALGCQAIDVRRLKIRMAVTRQIAPITIDRQTVGQSRCGIQ